MEHDAMLKKRLIIRPKSLSMKLGRYMAEAVEKYIAEEEVAQQQCGGLLKKAMGEYREPGPHNVQEWELIEYRKRDIAARQQAINYAKEVLANLNGICEKKYLLDY